jgi:2-oxoglutarate dehydrogenase E1 component
MTVAQPSTPANYFHLLRWQALSPREKPLIVFTPKQLLRLKAATSATSEFTSGSFRPVIGETAELGTVRRVLLTTGRLYYDLVGARDKAGDTSTAIIRIERLYPLPVDEIKAELAKYPADAELIWVQDEPANMGAWPFMSLKLPAHLEGRELKRVSRRASSSPAVGSAKMHAAEQQGLLAALFGER